MKTMWLCAVGLLLTCAVPAVADVTIEMKLNESPQTILASAHNIRMDGLDMLTIFRGDKKVLWTADLVRKTYTEMTDADMKAMGEELNKAMTQLQDKLKDLPPEQRAAVEAMMSKHPAMHEAPKPTVKATGKSKTVNGWPCKEYTSTSESAVMEVWATDPKNVNLGPSDLAAFKEFAEFMKQMLPGMGAVEGFIKDFDKPAEGQVPGVPVLTISRNEKGEATFRSELVKVTKGSITASKFELPEGLTKEKLPQGRVGPQAN